MPMFGRKPRLPRGDETTIFFATDLHGSEVCFKKFVNAAAFYKADVLLLGGDISGKMVVPVVEDRAGRYRAKLHGQEHLLETGAVEDFERKAWNAGLYTRRMTPEEHRHYADHPEALDGLFSEVVTQTVRRWIDYAHDRLSDTNVVIYNAPGNDDPMEVDAVVQEHGGDRFRFVEGDVIEVAPGHEMLSTGYTNHTPWNTHREYTEEEIAARLRSMTDRLENPSSALFNIHVPPYNSRIDSAPMLGDNLVVQTSAGGQLTAPVGSTAVRAAIEEVQPLVSLHGHIHESGGATRIGQTLAINAGSEYGEGVLHGVLITVGGGRLLRHQAVTG